MATLRDMYIDYAINHHFKRMERCDQDGFICFSYDKVDVFNLFDWKGKLIENRIEFIPIYVWFGKKGAVYVTTSTSFNKNAAIHDTNFVYRMKEWIRIIRCDGKYTGPNKKYKLGELRELPELSELL